MQSSTSRQKVQGAETRDQCFKLRVRGLTYAEIGAELGISAQAAHAHVKKYLQETAASTAEVAEEVRTLELDRLDKMLSCLWGAVLDGDPRAVEKALKVMERRAKMLGIDAPTVVHQTIEAPGIDAARLSDDALRELMAARAAHDTDAG